MKSGAPHGASATGSIRVVCPRGSNAISRSAPLVLALFTLPLAAENVVVSVVDDADQPVADAAVYLTPSRPAPPAPAGSAESPAIMDQIGYQFVPRVLIVRTGTEVAFPNSDNVLHHVYSFSEAKRFELPLYAGATHPPVLFDRAGLVTLGCNIHDDMVGYVVVVDTPYFGKTGVDGRVLLAELPAGDYDVAAWSSRQRDTTAVRHEQLAVGTADTELTLALVGRLRAPLPEGRPGALWKAY